MNRPTSALMRAFLEDVKPELRRLQAEGWPIEIVVVDEPTFVGVRLQVPLDGLRVPMSSDTGVHRYEGPPVNSVSFQ